ncbi:hypothetical protein APHAL10511_008507 [Amanita phalloides]|nr:hypothetical protein APHAL10511_008507 [Amanita phalloides]
MSAWEQHVKIGRQTNAKTAPGERNGYFDSKVLSRQHAEVWEEGGKIFIKDVKSSNGTFINGERLSPESVESEPFELKGDDIVEFGIDIVGEDNKTIIHHKVAARVVCVFNEQDVQVAARAEQHQQQQQYHQGAAGLHSGQPNPNSSAGTFNFAGAQQQRRTQLAQQGLTGMGGMGGNIRPPGKSGLSFELIFSRLQGELQKTKDTGMELQNLTSALGEIQDTLGGALPQDMPPPPHALPPVRPPQQQPPAGESSSAASANAASEAPAPVISRDTLLEIQTRLQDTQSSLASHVDKIRALETILAEQEALKREIRLLRDMMEIRERDPILVAAHPEQEAGREKDDHSLRKPRSNFDDDDDDDDDDDARSVATITDGRLERVDEEPEDSIEPEDRHHLDDAEIHDSDSETDEEKHRRREELGRPRTPEPTMGVHAAILNGASHRSRSPSQSQTENAAPAQPDTKEISEQLSTLSEQVRTVLAVKSVLEAQHVAAQVTIQALEKKVETLEAAVKTAQEHAVAAPLPPVQPPVTTINDEPKETLTDILSEWKKSVQGQWTSVQEEWSQERERLSRAREEFVVKTRQIDEGLERISGLESTVSAVQQTQTAHVSQLTTLQTWMSRVQEGTSWFQQHPHANGDSIKHGMRSGLVTPPSPPRSRSSDSSRYARRRRKRSSGAAARKAEANGNDADEGSSPSSSPASSPERNGSRSRSRERRGGRRGADSDADAVGSDDHLAHTHAHTRERTAQKLVTLLKKRVNVKEEEDDDDDVRMLALAGEMKTYISMLNPEKSLATPDPSVVDRASLSGSITSSVDPEEGDEPESEVRKKPVELEPVSLMNVQTAIGVLILGVATAAVVWRIKPE